MAPEPGHISSVKDMNESITNPGRNGEQEEVTMRSTFSCEGARDYLSELRKVGPTIPALIVSTISFWYVQPIVTIFAGHLGKVELDAVGLACSLINILYVNVLFGMAGACDIAFAQAFGGSNKKLIGVYLQRCIIFIGLTMVAFLSITVNLEGILLLLGQDPEVARLTGRYHLIFIPGSVALVLFFTLQRYIQCQNILLPEIWMGVLAHAFHAVLQYVMLYELNMGIDGSAIAQSLFYILFILMRLAFCAWSEDIKASWGGWTLQCLGGWGPIGKLAAYAALLLCAEWWSIEILILLSGILGVTELAAQTVLYNTALLISSIHSGVALAFLIRLGHLLGSGDYHRAKVIARLATILMVIFATFWTIVLLICGPWIGHIFTSDREVLDLVTDVSPAVAFFIFFDSVSGLTRYLFRGALKQKEAAIFVMLAYYGLSLPIGCCLTFLTPIGIEGLWIGLGVAVCIYSVVMAVRMIFFFDWQGISLQAQKVAIGHTDFEPEEKEKLIPRTDHVNRYGTTYENEDEPDSVPDAILSTSLAHASTANFTLQVEPITRRMIVQRVLVILVFVSIFLAGVITRLATQGIIDDLYESRLGGGDPWRNTTATPTPVGNHATYS